MRFTRDRDSDVLVDNPVDPILNRDAITTVFAQELSDLLPLIIPG
jgi:hypothetical protein